MIPPAHNHHVQAGRGNGEPMSGDSEDFLYLDDDESPSPPKDKGKRLSLPKVSLPKAPQIRQKKSREAIPAEPIESPDIGLSFDGTHSFDWEIMGMDCPDCAMKATKAVSRLPGIESCKISVADGTVEMTQDVSRGTTSRASTVLSSLGHHPNMGWMYVVGANPERLASERGMDTKMLIQWLNGVPGVLDARITGGRIEIQKVWIKDVELRETSNAKLSEILGQGFNLAPSRQTGFRKDQIQLLSAVLAIPLIALVAAVESSTAIPSLVAWILALSGIAFAGSQLFLEAIASLQNRVVGFQVLTSLAVIGAVALGELVEALMVVALVAFASHLENRALIRARESMQGGLDRIPRRARVVTKEGKQKHSGAVRELTVIATASNLTTADCQDDMVPVEALEVGEMVEVRSGETVPVDGIVVEGSGAIDRAPLTGEPIPVPVKEGDRIEAGLTLVRGPLVVKSEATGEGTRLSSLIDLVKHYKDQPTRTQSTIESFTLIWTPLVVIASPVFALLIFGATKQAVLTTLLLWVVSCPCSLLLASPVPHAAALTTASAFGLIARGGDVLESASEVELAMLDKTGTLTSGKPTISQIYVSKGEDEDNALSIAAGIEARSNHPYARTIIEAATRRGLNPTPVSGISDGEAGVSGKIGPRKVMLGRSDWLLSNGVSMTPEIEAALQESRDAGRGASVLALDGKPIAAFGFAHDDAREGVLEAISELRSHGVKIEILSGDEQASVEAFAREIGIDPSLCKGGVDPEGKAEYVTKRSSDDRTLMAGDGFNDAGALAAADIGVAVGSGDQVNLEAADVLIPGQDPRALSRMVALAKRTRKVVYANIAISVAVTLTLVLAVISGFKINLAAGIALHEASAIIIILNGMWVSGTGANRLSILAALGRDIGSDIAEIANIILGKEGDDSSATA